MKWLNQLIFWDNINLQVNYFQNLEKLEDVLNVLIKKNFGMLPWIN